jgi:hypothetical protein
MSHAPSSVPGGRPATPLLPHPQRGRAKPAAAALPAPHTPRGDADPDGHARRLWGTLILKLKRIGTQEDS